MADEQMKKEEVPGGPSASVPPSHPPPFLEVLCKSSGKIRRFAAGTEAGYALYVMNQKLDDGLPGSLYIEAVKEGEESVYFGPKALLINYGQGWKLQTITEDRDEAKRTRKTPKEFYNRVKSGDSSKKRSSELSSNFVFHYIGKILLTFVFMFLLGGALTVFLENLPTLISFISSFT